MKNLSMVGGQATAALAPDSLQHHLHTCTRARGRSFALRAWCEQAHDALIPRFGTTVAVASMCIAVIALLA
jgi:hypothetical protein